MVKGNWERRAELSVKRREAEKEHKAKKRAGVKSGSAIASSLLARSSGSEVPWSIQVYMFKEEEASMVCSKYLRGNECDQKDFKKGSRGAKKGCRLSHYTETLEVVEEVGNIEEDEEEAVIGPFDLHSLSTKRYTKIAFIAVDGVLVFDHKRDVVWLESELSASKSRSGSMVDAPPSASFPAKKEGAPGEDTPDIGDVRKCPPGACPPGAEEACAGTVTVTKTSTTLLMKALKRGISHMGVFLEDYEIVRMRAVNKEVKAYIASCSTTRTRLREGQTLRAGALAKRRKEEKKKRQKMDKKKDKKDGFARGGASGT
jgi:hypothetical protein